MDLYKKIGDKAKKAYRSWASEPKIQYELLKESSESIPDKVWHFSRKSSEEEIPSDEGSREAENSFCETETIVSQSDKRKQRDLEEEKSMCLARFLTASRIQEKEEASAIKKKNRN